MQYHWGPVDTGEQGLTHKDVGGLEVPVQDGRLAGVQVQHAPGNGAHPAGKLEDVQLTLGSAMQQQVQGALGAVLSDQDQVLLPPADAPERYHIVVRACPAKGCFDRLSRPPSTSNDSKCGKPAAAIFSMS